MKDVAALIEAAITATTNNTATYWQETDPSLTDIVWTQDEFDPRNPKLQVLFENFPDKKTWCHDNTYRVEHKCRITIFLKPTRYVESEIDANKVTYFNARNEIDRILSLLKYSIEGITNLELSANGWNDKNSIRVGRGTKDMGTFLQSRGGADTAIEFRSEQVVTAIYYIPDYMFLTVDSVNTNGSPLHIGTIEENGVTYTLPDTHNETLHTTKMATFSNNDIFLGWAYTSNLQLDNATSNPVNFTVIDIGTGYLDAVIEESFVENVSSAYFKVYGEVYLAEPELTDGGGYFYSGTFTDYENQTASTAYREVYGTNYLAQIFKPATTHYCQAIKLYLAAPFGFIGNVTVTMKWLIGETWYSISTLATIEGNKLDTDAAYIIAYFDNPVLVSTFFSYMIIISAVDATAAKYLNVAFNESGGYANGAMYTSTDSGGNWTLQTNYDILFYDEGS